MAKRLKKRSRDRISNLPDPVIHKILSFMPTNYMVSLRMVSKRFNQLCLSSPNLKFSNTRLHRCTIQRRGFRRFVDKFMSESSNFGNLQCLHLSLCTYIKENYAKERSRVLRWIKKAAESNVKELKLELNLPEEDSAREFMNGIGTYVSTIFTCKNLRVLEIYMLKESWKMVELPLVVLSSLEHLTLKSVTYGGQIPFPEWLSTYCPSLRKLNLAFMKGNLGAEPHKLEVTHHVLEDIKIIYCQTSTSYDISLSCDNLRAFVLKSEKSVDVEVSAPDLKVLTWEGNPRIGLWNVDSLSTVIVYSENFSEMHLYYQVVELVKLWKSVKGLHLTMNIIEFLFIGDHEQPILFDKLNNLEITLQGSLEEYHVQVIENFITRMPNLASLTIRQAKCPNSDCQIWKNMVRSDFGRSKAPQRSEFLVQNRPVLVSTVKEMKIEFNYLYAVHNEHKKFIQYFLETMDALEKMTICSSFTSFKHELAFLEKRPKVASPGLLIFRKVKKQQYQYMAERCFELE